MSAEIATAYVRIRPNMAGFRSQTESGVKGAFSGVGKIVGVAFGAVAVGEIVKSSVEAAATVQKQMEVVRNEFGKSGEALINFAHTTGIALGGALSTSTLGFSAQMGILYKNMGFTTMAGAKMTEGWEKLGLAFNAVKGGGASGAVDVLQRLQLAATGASTRGLRALGISLQSSTLQAYAFAHGITNSATQALQPAQKALITYQIAMQHMPQLLALAQKHSNDFANVQARLTAQWEEARIEIGNALLPAMTSLAMFLAKILPGAVRGVIAVVTDFKTALVGAFDFLKPALVPVWNVLKSIREAFAGGGGITGAVGRLRDDFSKLSPAAKIAVVALGGIAAAFAAITISAFPITSIVLLGVALGEAYRRSAAFRDIIGKVGDFLRGTVAPAVQHAIGAINRFFNSAPVKSALIDAFNGTKAAVLDMWRTFKVVFADIRPIVVGAVAAVVLIWRHFGGTIVAEARASLDLALATIRHALELIRGIFDFFSGLLTLNWHKMWKGIKEILGSFLHEMTSALRAWGGVVKQFFVDLWHTIEKVVLEGLLKVVNLFGKIPTKIHTPFGSIGFTNPFVGWSQSLQSTINAIGDAGKRASDISKEMNNRAAQAAAGGFDSPAAKAKLKKMGSDAASTVTKATSDGITNGVTKTMPALAQGISNAVQNAIQAAHQKIVSTVQAAKNNLDKIGADLAKTIDQIQQKIGGAAGAVAGSPQGAAFAKLKKLIEAGAPSFEIAKAQAELNAQLQNVGKSQKTQVQSQLANLTAAFDKGNIGFREFETRLHDILRKDGITLAQAMKAGGPAFADAFKAQLAALRKQAQAIAALPAKFRGIGGAGGAADIKIIRPLQVIHDAQQKIAVAEAKAQAQALKQQQKQTAYVQQMATVGVHVLPGRGPGVAHHVRGAVGSAGGGAATGVVTPQHVAGATTSIVRALARVCDDIIAAGKDIVHAELTVRTPIENLRRTELRIADEAAKQRQAQLREARRTNTLLSKLERGKGPVPGFGKERPGTGGKHARRAAAAGVKA